MSVKVLTATVVDLSMSFRELRNLTEVMRSLGYPKPIAMESFRAPNFELVADCLYWLFQRYDPGADVVDDISTESDRVLFLQSIAQSLLVKARMKLNIKRLYQADGAAVRELLKLASLLHRAMAVPAEDDEETGADTAAFKRSLQDVDAKAARQLTGELTRAGAAVYDVLQHERELREVRQRAIGRNMDGETIERTVREAIASVNDNAASVDRLSSELDEHARGLQAKLDKRRSELERAERRLSTLTAVRPAYMDEYERLQGELQDLFTLYLQRFRNLEFLEGQLEAHHSAQRSKMDAADRTLKKMQRRLQEDELRVLRGEAEVDEAHVDDDSAVSEDAPSDTGRGAQPAPAGFVTAGRGPSFGGGGEVRTTTRGGQVLGTLTGAGSDLSGDSIVDDTGSESTHISINDGGLSDAELFKEDYGATDLTEGEELDNVLESDDNDF